MAKYKGTGLSGKIKIVDSAGNFSSTDLKTVLEELMDGAGGTGSSIDYSWKKHETFLYDGVSTTKTLPTNWTDLHFRLMPGTTGSVISYDNTLKLNRIELQDFKNKGFALYNRIRNGSGGSLYFTINLDANTYTLDAFGYSTHHLLVYYKNAV